MKRLIRRSAEVLVALAVLAPGSAAAAPATVDAGPQVNGYWFAWNNDRQDVSFEIRKRRIVRFSTAFNASCYSGKWVLYPEFPPRFLKKKPTIPIDRNGNFRLSYRGSGRVSLKDNTQTIKGTLRNGRIKGSFSMEGLCRGQTAFSAYRLDGIPGGGN